MKKRFFALLLSVLLVFTLVGCKGLEDVKDSLDSNKENTEDKDSENTTVPKVEERQARLYFFDTTTSELYYVDEKIEVKDGNLFDGLSKALQNNTYSNNFVTMSNLAELDSAKLDNNTGVLTVKFKNNFFSKMNIGDISESGFYAALITTYAFNYGVDKVALYQAEELYTGMRGELPDGYSEVSFDDAKKFVKEEYDVNKVEEKNCRLFYYTAVDDKIYYVDTTMQVTGKAIVKGLTNALKSSPNDTFFKLGEDVDVTTAENKDGILTVDLNAAYYNILSKVGSGSEAGVLRSLAYTYGYYYGVGKVIIKVDGKNYSGSHIAYEDGEYITVDTSEITKLNN